MDDKFSHAKKGIIYVATCTLFHIKLSSELNDRDCISLLQYFRVYILYTRSDVAASLLYTAVDQLLNIHYTTSDTSDQRKPLTYCPDHRAISP